MSNSWTTRILWIVYLCLLAVLLPHTAWAFASMEPSGAVLVPWVAAIAFEAAIAALTHKLAGHMEKAGKKHGWKRFSHMYMNVFAFGLLAATAISALANLAHAVEFSQPLRIFTEWGISPGLYSVAFGGILPVVSLVFARVLSNVTESEEVVNPELEKANTTIRELTKRVKETEYQAKATIQSTEERANTSIQSAEARAHAAEERARTAEIQAQTAGDMVRWMFTESKRERILAIKKQWPALSQNAVAVLADTTPSHVSATLADAIDVTAEYEQVKQ